MATNRLLTLNKEEDLPDHPEGDLKPAVAPATESAPAPESAPEPAVEPGPEPVVEPVPESAVAGVEKEHDTPFSIRRFAIPAESGNSRNIKEAYERSRSMPTRSGSNVTTTQKWATAGWFASMQRKEVMAP